MNFIRPWLAVGKYSDVRNYALLEQESITATLQFVEERLYDGIETCYIPIDDGIALEAHVLRKGVDFILRQHTAERKVLSACGAGVSRSVVFAAAALKEAEGLSLLEAITEVKYYRHEALPNPIVWRSVCDYYDEAVSFVQMRDAFQDKLAKL